VLSPSLKCPQDVGRHKVNETQVVAIYNGGPPGAIYEL
jgi:hypothetical protein